MTTSISPTPNSLSSPRTIAPETWPTGRTIHTPKFRFASNSAGHINFPVTLDGKDVRATLDTGASRSVLGLEAAEDTFSFDEKNASLKVLGTTRSGHSYKFPFNTLLFGEAGAVLGSVTVINPDLILVSRSDSRLPGSPDLILGMGVLRQLHLYIDYKEKKLYVTAASAH